MSNRIIFLLGAAIVVVALFFMQKPERPESSYEDETETAQEAEAQPKSADDLENKDASASNSDLKNETGTATIKADSGVVSEEVQKKFSQHLRALEKCIGLNAASGAAEKTIPSLESLTGLLRSSLGESVLQIEDWSQFDIIDRGGAKKRVRVDYDYPDGVTPNRRLSIYTVNSYGALEVDDLTEDQANNPNMAYVESLKEGVRLLTDEKSARLYYSQGEELVYTIKDGKLDSFSVARSDKAMNCVNLSEESSRCTCP